MTLHRISLAACRPQPWKNGGGITRELLAWPTAAGPAHWQLRVSVADITDAGPFSAFDGVDRWFAVLEGAGVVLRLPNGERAITRDDDALSFAGEAAPGCHLIEGPTRDLNLMLRRGAGVAAMRRAMPGSTLSAPTRWRALYAHDATQLQIDDHTEPLAAGTLLWSEGEEAAEWHLSPHAAPGRAWWMMLGSVGT